MSAFLDQLQAARVAHRSFLCVGLDPDPARFPAVVGNYQDRKSVV